MQRQRTTPRRGCPRCSCRPVGVPLYRGVRRSGSEHQNAPARHDCHHGPQQVMVRPRPRWQPLPRYFRHCAGDYASPCQRCGPRSGRSTAPEHHRWSDRNPGHRHRPGSSVGAAGRTDGPSGLGAAEQRRIAGRCCRRTCHTGTNGPRSRYRPGNVRRHRTTTGRGCRWFRPRTSSTGARQTRRRPSLRGRWKRSLISIHGSPMTKRSLSS